MSRECKPGCSYGVAHAGWHDHDCPAAAAPPRIEDGTVIGSVSNGSSGLVMVKAKHLIPEYRAALEAGLRSGLAGADELLEIIHDDERMGEGDSEYAVSPGGKTTIGTERWHLFETRGGASFLVATSLERHWLDGIARMLNKYHRMMRAARAHGQPAREGE